MVLQTGNRSSELMNKQWGGYQKHIYGTNQGNINNQCLCKLKTDSQRRSQENDQIINDYANEGQILITLYREQTINNARIENRSREAITGTQWSEIMQSRNRSRELNIVTHWSMMWEPEIEPEVITGIKQSVIQELETEPRKGNRTMNNARAC